MSEDTRTSITLTREEQDHLWFIPQAPGGKVVSERLQQRFTELGLTSSHNGTLWLNMFGDRVRRGAVKVVIEG